MTLQTEFIELMPDVLEEGVLYISMVHSVAIHKCACGCGEEVITPLDPSAWNLYFDGKTVTLKPSIGNWNFNCQSHYFITRNEIVHCFDWDDEEVTNEKKKNDIWWKKLFPWRR